MNYKRVLLKITGEVMNGGGDSVYEYDAIRAVVNNIAQLHKK